MNPNQSQSRQRAVKVIRTIAEVIKEEDPFSGFYVAIGEIILLRTYELTKYGFYANDGVSIDSQIVRIVSQGKVYPLNIPETRLKDVLSEFFIGDNIGFKIKECVELLESPEK